MRSIVIQDLRRICPAVLLTAAVGVMLHAQGQAQQRAPSLREFLARNGINQTAQLPANILNVTITGAAADEDDRQFFAAFFEASSGANPPLHVAELDRSTSEWRHRVLTIPGDIDPGNSIVDVKRTARYIFLTSHINPSASRLIVLSRDLTLRQTLNGWIVARLPNGSIVYHHNQVHFAPTHSLEMSIFDADTLTTRQIYPPKPYQPVRTQFIARVAEVYKQRGEQWFAQQNHHMEPELFDSSLSGEVTVDTQSGSIAFIVQFGDPQNGRDPVTFSQDIAVTCGPTDSIERMQCIERRR